MPQFLNDELTPDFTVQQGDAARLYLDLKLDIEAAKRNGLQEVVRRNEDLSYSFMSIAEAEAERDRLKAELKKTVKGEAGEGQQAVDDRLFDIIISQMNTGYYRQK